MLLAQGHGPYFLIHQRTPLSVFTASVASVLEAEGYSYDLNCLNQQMLLVYKSNDLSPYLYFRHVYDTMEYRNYYLDRWCLQKSLIEMGDFMYDPHYRVFVTDIRKAMHEAGLEEVFPEPLDWYEIMASSGLNLVDYVCAEKTFKLFGEERRDPVDCFYKAVVPFDDTI